MSVVNDTTIVPRSWRGYDDPSLPVGTWIGHTTLIGDATGGTMALVFAFKEEGQPATGRLYSVEQFDVFTTTITPNNFGAIRVLGFEQTPFIIGERSNHFFIDPIGPVFMGGHSFPPTPYFLGATHFLVDGGSTVRIEMINENITVMSAVLMGYMWEPRSILAPGGLKHPVEGLWGTGRG